MRKYLRRICRAQGVQWPGITGKGTRRRTPRGAKSMHERVQKVVRPERWIPNLKGRVKRTYELLGVWRDVG
jgi:hypothetical protein